MDNRQEMTTPLERFFTFWWILAGFVGFGLLALIVYVVGGKDTDEAYESAMGTRLATKAEIDTAQTSELQKVKIDLSAGVAALSGAKPAASDKVVPGSPTGIEIANEIVAEQAAQEKLEAEAEAAKAAALALANPGAPVKPKVEVQKLVITASNPAAAQPPMQFVEKELTAVAGKAVELTFKNPDTMLVTGHNVVICKPGKLDVVTAAATASAADPEFAKRGYVPESDDIIIGSKLLMPNEKQVLKFTIDEPGDYPYVCTFPGHFILMKGVLKVTK